MHDSSRCEGYVEQTPHSQNGARGLQNYPIFPAAKAISRIALSAATR